MRKLLSIICLYQSMYITLSSHSGQRQFSREEMVYEISKADSVLKTLHKVLSAPPGIFDGIIYDERDRQNFSYLIEKVASVRASLAMTYTQVFGERIPDIFTASSMASNVLRPVVYPPPDPPPVESRRESPHSKVHESLSLQPLQLGRATPYPSSRLRRGSPNMWEIVSRVEPEPNYNTHVRVKCPELQHPAETEIPKISIELIQQKLAVIKSQPQGKWGDEIKDKALKLLKEILPDDDVQVVFSGSSEYGLFMRYISDVDVLIKNPVFGDKSKGMEYLRELSEQLSRRSDKRIAHVELIESSNFPMVSFTLDGDKIEILLKNPSVDERNSISDTRLTFSVFRSMNIRELNFLLKLYLNHQNLNGPGGLTSYMIVQMTRFFLGQYNAVLEDKSVTEILVHFLKMFGQNSPFIKYNSIGMMFDTAIEEDSENKIFKAYCAQDIMVRDPDEHMFIQNPLKGDSNVCKNVTLVTNLKKAFEDLYDNIINGHIDALERAFSLPQIPVTGAVRVDVEERASAHEGAASESDALAHPETQLPPKELSEGHPPEQFQENASTIAISAVKEDASHLTTVEDKAKTGAEGNPTKPKKKKKKNKKKKKKLTTESGDNDVLVLAQALAEKKEAIARDLAEKEKAIKTHTEYITKMVEMILSEEKICSMIDHSIIDFFFTAPFTSGASAVTGATLHYVEPDDDFRVKFDHIKAYVHAALRDSVYVQSIYEEATDRVDIEMEYQLDKAIYYEQKQRNMDEVFDKLISHVFRESYKRKIVKPLNGTFGLEKDLKKMMDASIVFMAEYLVENQISLMKTAPLKVLTAEHGPKVFLDEFSSKFSGGVLDQVECESLFDIITDDIMHSPLLKLFELGQDEILVLRDETHETHELRWYIQFSASIRMKIMMQAQSIEVPKTMNEVVQTLVLSANPGSGIQELRISPPKPTSAASEVVAEVDKKSEPEPESEHNFAAL